jgi:hypothetical protein
VTRREALLAVGIMFVLLTGGLTWLFGPYGLISCALLGAAAVLLGFERVVERRGEAVSDAVPEPNPLLAALERDFQGL